MLKRKNKRKAHIYAEGGGQGFSNFMNSDGMNAALGTISSINTSMDDYKAGSGTSYLSTMQANRKGSGNAIFDGVGKAVDGALQIADMIDKATHKKDNRSLEEIAGLYACGGHIYDAGGKMDAIGDAVGTAAALYGNAQAQASIKDTTSLKGNIANNNVGAYNSSMSFDDVSNQFNSLRTMQHVSAHDLRPNSWGSDIINSLSAGNQGAQAGMSLAGPVGAIAGGVIGTASSIVGSLFGRNKAKKEAKKLNNQIDYKNNYNDRALTNNLENVGNQQLNSALANINAFGGPMGGSGIFDSGLSFINEGGTHEQNPNDGIQVGVDNEGTPNLVEEGEVIWKAEDYVFSKRLKASRKDLKDNNLSEAYAGKSFAEIATEINKEAEERPIDNVSRRGKEVLLSRLMTVQEALRERRQTAKVKKAYNSLPPEAQEDLMIADNQNQQAQEEAMMQEQMMQQGMPQQGMFACGGHLYPDGGYQDTVHSYRPVVPQLQNRVRPESPNPILDLAAPYTIWKRPDGSLYNLNYYDQEVNIPYKEAVKMRTEGLNRLKAEKFAYNLRHPNKKAEGGPMGNIFEGDGAFTNHLYNWGEAPTWADTPTYLWGNKYVDGATPDKVAEAMAMIKGFKPTFDGHEISATGDQQVRGTTLGEVKVNGKQKDKDAGTLEDTVVIGNKKSKRAKGVKIPIPSYEPDTSKKLDTSKIGIDPLYSEKKKNGITRQSNHNAELMRLASLVPGLYGLSNPPAAHYMTAGQARDVSFTPSGVDINLDRTNPWFLADRLTENARATDRALMNSSGNRNQAMAGLLSNGYNLNKSLGDAYIEGLKYNNALNAQEAEFYNQRDLANAQGFMQAAAHNQSSDNAALQRAMAAAEYNGNEADKVYATRMANLENLFGNISNIGEDIMNRQDAEFAAKANREAVGTTGKKCKGGKMKRRHLGLTI